MSLFVNVSFLNAFLQMVCSRSAAGNNDIKGDVKLTEERVSGDEKTEELDYLSQQLLIRHRGQNPPSSFTGFDPYNGSAVKNAAAETNTRKSHSKRVEVTKPIGEIVEEVDFISQHSIDSNPGQQTMSTFPILNVDSDSAAKQQPLQKRRQEKLDKQKLESAVNSRRVVISEVRLLNYFIILFTINSRNAKLNNSNLLFH